MPRYRLNLNLPVELWQILRDLAARWNTTPDGAVRRLIAEAKGGKRRSDLPAGSCHVCGCGNPPDVDAHFHTPVEPPGPRRDDLATGHPRLRS